MKIEISNKPKLIHDVAQKHDTSIGEIEGYFLYDFNYLCINLNCDTFLELSFDEFVKEFTRVITHEILHRLIFQETEMVANEAEEQIIEGMTEQW